MVSFEKAVGEQLCKIQDELRKIRILNEVQEARDVGAVYIAIPETGATRSFSTGTTVIDFLNGKIKNPDGSTEQLQVSLQRLAKDFLHSLSLTSDKDIVLQIGTQNKRTVEANLGLELPYLTYKEISITTTATTNISIYASTNPFSTVNGNTVSIMKGKNALGEPVTVLVDSSGNISALLKGSYLGTPTTLAVDVSGNIVAVMKGTTGSGLQTIQTDSDGKMLAKIYDPPDVFGTSINIGFAEALNRLNFPLMYEKRGEILWGDDFEASALKWDSATSGTGAAVALDTTRALSGEQSVKLTAGTDASKNATISRYIWFQGNQRIGVEAKLSFSNATLNDCQITILQLYGAAYYAGTLKIDASTLQAYYKDVNGDFQSFGVVGSLVTGNHAWYPVKLVVDFSTGKYVRAFVENVQYDLSAYDMPPIVGTGDNFTQVTIKETGDAGGNKSVWVDDVVITANEP